MEHISATEARKRWSEVLDLAVRQKPQFIKRTRDQLMLSDVDFINTLLSGYVYEADILKEADGSITLSLRSMDLIEHAATLSAAKKKLAAAILDYAMEYYSDMAYWHSAQNRRDHLPYVMKALTANDVEQIGAELVCHDGRN